ncbi:MAG: hypothetical protein U0Q12_12835 [Vicinamibacterales bacterium]
MAESTTYAPSVVRQAQARGYRRRPGDPGARPLRIYTLDPSTARVDAPIATVDVPWEPLDPGPAGTLFVIDPTDGDDINAGVDLDDPRILIRGGLEPSVSDHRFHQQMVYAVCARVYEQFQQALGRLIAWGFDTSDGLGRLRVRPHAPECRANAVYQKELGQISFGYFPGPADGAGRIAPGGRVFTCLSHDIVAHELTHALLDGLRSRFNVPTGGDVLGFHEGFADLVAVFQHLRYGGVVTAQLRAFEGRLESATLVASLAQQFGEAVQGHALRCAVTTDVQRYRPDMEAHEKGSVLLSAVFAAFLAIYRRKAEPLVGLAARLPSGRLPEDLVSLLAAKAGDVAGQFLNLCIRAVDYCPPVDLHLGEYLRALVTADRELVPDDRWGYRDALIGAFAERGIYPPGVNQLTEDELCWRAPTRFIEPIADLHFSQLRFAGDPSLPVDEEEAVRQAEALWRFVTRAHVAEEFGLAPPGAEVEPCCVESIRTSRRIGPDGHVVFDLVAEVTQRRHVVDPVTGARAKFFGGCTVIIGPEGETRFIVSKNVNNRERLERQLTHQRESGLWEVVEGRYRMRGYANELAHRLRSPDAR